MTTTPRQLKDEAYKRYRQERSERGDEARPPPYEKPAPVGSGPSALGGIEAIVVVVAAAVAAAAAAAAEWCTSSIQFRHSLRWRPWLRSDFKCRI